MAQLKTLPHTSTGTIREVTFDTDQGHVEIFEFDGQITMEIAFEEVSADEFEKLLNDVSEHDEFDNEAETVARELLADAREQTAYDADKEEAAASADTDEPEDDTTGETVHVTEDGTEIRVGDRINHPSGGDYRIVGREDAHTLRKVDNTDNWGVTVSTAENDIRERGFAERAEGADE